MIEQWNNGHSKEIQEMEAKLKPFNQFKPIWGALDEINKKANDLISRGFDVDGHAIEKSLNSIKTAFIPL